MEENFSWLTLEEIRRRAAISPESALDVTIEHHMQLLAAAPEKLKLALNSRLVGLHSGWCGLCYRNGAVLDGCPLVPSCTCTGPCCQEWVRASSALAEWQGNTGTWDAWQQAEGRLLARLERIVL